MTDLSINSRTDQDPTLDRCPTCEHPFSAHDRIGVRWCAATQLGVGQRECVCSVAAGTPSSTRHILGSDQTRVSRALTLPRAGTAPLTCLSKFGSTLLR